MSSYRLPNGGLVDRSAPLSFTFDGARYSGFEGDTLASALMANGVRLVGRSFKYHRPRGMLSAGPEEPSALVTLRTGARREPNTKATMVPLYDGLVATSQNRWPSLEFDIMAANQLAGPLLSAGFYYKTFMGPTAKAWMAYEHFIRQAAGLGRATHEPDPDRYDKANVHCDVLVVGGGAAGLAAASAAASSGARVIVADENARLGGSLLTEAGRVNGQSAVAFAEQHIAALATEPGVTLMPRTAVYGYYDSNVLGAVEQIADHLPVPPTGLPRQRHWTITAGRVVLATGAIERPIVFPGNDTPGVMLAESARTYVIRYGVRPAARAVLFATHDAAYRVARDAARAGVEMAAIVDPRPAPGEGAKALADEAGIPVMAGHGVMKALGGKALNTVVVAPMDLGTGAVTGPESAIAADGLFVSGGWTPTVHLASQAGGAPVWDGKIAAFVPGAPRQAWTDAGACAGTFALSACLADGARLGALSADTLGFAAKPPPDYAVEDDLTSQSIAFVRKVKPTGRAPKAFVDLQHDVTASDVALAHREGFQSVEHLKRYTTLGMAADQGKTSNVTGLALMAEARRQDISHVGTTRFRPPYTPVSLGALAGFETGHHFYPKRRSPMDLWHRENGGDMTPVGLWDRPRAYLQDGETMTEAYVREAAAVRAGVGLVDVSTLGKIDVQGPDAATFLDRVYANGFAKLPVGKARYGLMLREDGLLFDDGTTWRLSETQYLMTTTTANAGPVMAHLEYHLDIVWPEMRVALASVTDQWAAVAIAGPQAREVLWMAIDDIDFSNDALPFMGVRQGTLDGETVWVARLSFSGELAYEVYIGAHFGLHMWQRLLEAGQPFGIIPYGLEALGTLRIEKGHVAGGELDGRTTADDLGLGRMASTKKAYIGGHMTGRPGLADDRRFQLVGVKALDDQPVRAGSHIVVEAELTEPAESLGHVTAYTYSPAVNAHIGLALVENGRARIGERHFATYPLKGHHVPVELVDPCFFDPDGERMHG